MRKTLITTLLIAALPLSAMAVPTHQEQGRHPAHVSQHHAPGVELSREQRKAMAELHQQAAKAKREIHQRYLDKLPANERTAMDNELKAATDKRDQAFKALLTPEQQQAFSEAQERREKQRSDYQAFKKWQAEQKN